MNEQPIPTEEHADAGPRPRLARVAVLGGGAGALSAAFELTKPGWRERFESITVYQQGFRLGGKGASGRGANQRIEEHGLHIWLGFYDEAFTMLRACYEELARPPDRPLATIEEAFERASFFVLQEPTEAGWVPWAAAFPETDEVPGLPNAAPMPTMWSCLVSSIRLARTFLHSVDATQPGLPPDVGLTLHAKEPLRGSASGLSLHPLGLSAVGQAIDGVKKLVGLRRFLNDFVESAADIALAGVIAVMDQMHPDPTRHDAADHAYLVKLIDSAVDALPGAAHAGFTTTPTQRRYLDLIDAMLAIARGVLVDGLLTHPDGIWAADDYDFSDWLILHGADPKSARSPLVKTLAYDLPFSYEDGEPTKPRNSAASALNGLWLTFFGYRGALAWKMRAGMGDVVFAPIYEVLKRRGVRFEFFHRVEALHLSEDRSHIASVDLAVQASLKYPQTGYDPLIDVKGLPSWPNRPDASQLLDAKNMTPEDVESFWSRWPTTPKVLRIGVDFDELVLGIPVGSHQFICAELIEDRPEWRASSERIGTIYTQGVQLWMKPPMSELGWEWPPATMGGYTEPYDTIADMCQLITAEDWPADAVGSIAYLCNSMPTPPGPIDRNDHELPKRASESARLTAIEFLRTQTISLWPRAVLRYPTDFDWSVLTALDDSEGENRFNTQFWRANVDPSERYVQSLPGTTRYRLAPGGSGYSNLWLAGDWTSGKLPCGCVEAAVSSGIEAGKKLRTANAERRKVAP